MSARLRAQRVIDAGFKAHGEDTEYLVWNSGTGAFDAPVPVRVVPTTSQQQIDGLGGRVLQDQNLFEVRVTEVAVPKKLDAIDYAPDGLRYPVVSVEKKT